jgi:heme-degrading monooxygenase HmoA
MLNLRPLDERVPIQQQLTATASPAILINIFSVAPADVDALLAAWEHDANWMKKQPGYISTQLHRGIGGSCTFFNYAVWESVEHFRAASPIPSFAAHWRRIHQARSPRRIYLPRSACPISAPPSGLRRHAGGGVAARHAT